MLDRARGSINVLDHPFYLRWNAGDLSAEELGIYAAEYRHAVLALAQASALAAAKADQPWQAGLLEHAAEERGARRPLGGLRARHRRGRCRGQRRDGASRRDARVRAELDRG